MNTVSINHTMAESYAINTESKEFQMGMSTVPITELNLEHINKERKARGKEPFVLDNYKFKVADNAGSAVVK